MENYLIFKFNSESYALNVKNIKEIIEYQEHSKIPSSEDHVLGLIKIRNKIITLMDTKAILNDERINSLENSKILIIENGETLIGVVVDHVDSVINISNEEINPSPLTNIELKNNKLDYVKGVVNKEDSLIIVIDINKTKVFMH